MTIQSHNHSRYSILFVDDEEKSLKYFKQAFCRHFNILTASGSKEAKQLIIEHPGNVGVLITDKRMPDENGIELLEWVKKQNPDIIRLLTTAFANSEETIEAINKGHIYRYVPKPWQAENLLNDLKSAMNLFMQQKLDGKRAEKCIRSSAILAAYFVNKLKSPLLNIDNTAKNIQVELPKLIDKLKQSRSTESSASTEQQLEILRTTPESLRASLQIANTEIDTFLLNIGRKQISQQDIISFSIRDCINSSLSQCFVSEHFRKSIYFDSELDFIVLGIEDLIKFVLLSLLNNAIDALSATNAGEIIIRLETGKNYNYLYIKDTGIGMANNILPHIFDEYFSTKPNHIGLGLTFCKTVMQELDGDIKCHTQKNFYTEFSLNFPKVATLSSNKKKTPH